jgi:hypothetical protein
MLPEHRLPMRDEAQDAAERLGCRVRGFGQVSADSHALFCLEQTKNAIYKPPGNRALVAHSHSHATFRVTPRTAL